MSGKGDRRRPGTIAPGIWERIFNKEVTSPAQDSETGERRPIEDGLDGEYAQGGEP